MFCMNYPAHFCNYFSYQELEQKLCRHNEAAEISKLMQSQLTKYRELEKENARLVEDNCYYR